MAERKRAEETLRASQQIIERIINAIPVRVFWKDSNLVYLGCNAVFARDAGFADPNDIIGKDDYQMAWGDQAELYRGDDRQVIESGCSKFLVEEPQTTPEGNLITLLTSKMALRNAKGEVSGVLGTHMDITERKRSEESLRLQSAALEAAANAIGVSKVLRDISERKRAEEALREKEQLLSEAQRLGHIGSWLYDMSGPMRWSEELYRVHGVSPDTFTPTVESLLGLIYPDDRPTMQAWMAACAGGEKPGESEFRINLPDGTIRWIRGDGDAVHDAENRLTHIAGTAQDITERKVAETKLAGLQKQLLDASRRAGMAEVATNVLHNVGNVLNSVNISTALVVQSMKQSRASSLARVVVLLQEHAHDLGTFITNDSRGKHLPAHLAQLSAHLLAEQATNVSELDSLRQNVEHIKEIVAMQQNYATFGGVKELVNIVDLVEDSLRLNESALGRHDVEVIRQFEQVPPMNVEKHKFLQVMVNLLRNAKHACQDSARADKRLTVRVANGEGWIRISVTNNGVGIPPENLTRIFNHGFTTRKGGHGFGLHSGALAAKEMDGSLAVHSDGPDQGATFTLELPCLTRESSHE